LGAEGSRFKFRGLAYQRQKSFHAFRISQSKGNYGKRHVHSQRGADSKGPPEPIPERVGPSDALLKPRRKLYRMPKSPGDRLI